MEQDSFKSILLENQGLVVVVLVMSSVTYLTLSIMLVMDMVYIYLVVRKVI